ncbi:hypothetical protein ACJIZ3_023423 [Penstemon smallii]|uniref:Lethal giant larvae (Lgl)-like C-terminal domain-containing protein n=1 Tax=Penstemon smallii TaxID=265156 RepID=A0ABD3TP27_9LAMI
MSAFLKKLVEKASLKKPGGFSDSLKPDDLSPRLVFHYGIPSGSMLLAYDSIQQILAISTKDGQIKLFGRDGSQAILESSETLPSKFFLFIENQGVLLNINVNNHIEVWDIDRKCLSYVHNYEKEITSFAALQHAPYLYVGDSTGSVSVLRLDQEHRQIELMKYHIPFSASHGKTDEVGSNIAIKHILPQPTAETKRLLIIYSDGVITLWSIQESKSIYIISSNGTALQSIHQETRKVTAACWACSSGTRIAVGYSNGDIFLWSVPGIDQSLQNELSNSQSTTPICKLNLGYKADKIPIGKLKWVDGDGKSSRLYALGFSDYHAANLLQVVLLNEHTESRTIKLGLHPPESLVDMEIITSSIEQNKNRHGSLLLLGRSSRIYAYDDSLIERYLVQCQTKSSPSLPKEITIKLPYGDSSITVTKFVTSIPCMPLPENEDFNNLPFFPFERNIKDGNSNSTFSRSRNLFITGHSNGAINFWDASCPLFLPVASITQQSDSDFSLSGVPLTALHFDYESRVLVSGDQSGMVRVYIFKSEPFAPQNTLLSFQGSSKKGSNHIIRRIKVVKVNGAVMYINTTENLKQLAIGSEQGYVSLIDPEGPNVIYQKHIASELCTGIISVHFETCNFHGFEKNVLIMATKDSSVVTLERDTGNPLCPGVVRPKKPYQGLFTTILDGRGSSVPDVLDTDSDNSVPKQSLVLLCSEKAVYVYSLSHLIQSVKKVLYKKKFHSSCLWASTFGSPDVGLVLLFASGKVEIRSLPELSLLKESLIRGLTFSNSRPSSISVSSSYDGELIIVNGDQEVFFISTLIHKETYRLMDSVSKVYNKDLHVAISSPVKEKKKGIFGSVIKDDKATKSKNSVEVEIENSRQSSEQLSTIFSTINFPSDNEIQTKMVVNEEDVDLDIDDIDIDDPKEKTRGGGGGYPVINGLNRMKITNKFQAIKGKLINAKAKNDKVPVNDEPHDDKAGSVDHIKKKYGYASSGESNFANTARTKLSENLNKLQGINMKTTEMQDTARSFSSMAKEVLRFAENEKKGS